MKDADAPARASLCDLLEVTRRVMAPVEANGTFWCQEVDAHQMVEWTLSVRARRDRARRRPIPPSPLLPSHTPPVPPSWRLRD
eukprot:24187-Pelagococcus_subviridis.AAC.7